MSEIQTRDACTFCGEHTHDPTNCNSDKALVARLRALAVAVLNGDFETRRNASATMYSAASRIIDTCLDGEEPMRYANGDEVF